MDSGLTAQDLADFETTLAEMYKAGKLQQVIHLTHGNEEQLIDIFKEVHTEDWVMGSWRMHFQCLLKGVPKEEVMAKVVAGQSIHPCFPEHRVLSSGIVGGILPIAVGAAMTIHRTGGTNKVWCFLGDMTSETGIAHECIKYSQNHNLPIRFVVEDNNFSVSTDTRKTWNMEKLTHEGGDYKVRYYKYDRLKYPHAG